MMTGKKLIYGLLAFVAPGVVTMVLIRLTVLVLSLPIDLVWLVDGALIFTFVPVSIVIILYWLVPRVINYVGHGKQL